MYIYIYYMTIESIFDQDFHHEMDDINPDPNPIFGPNSGG